MIEYNPKLINLIYDNRDNSYKIFTGETEYYWLYLDEAKFDKEGCLTLSLDKIVFESESVNGMRGEFWYIFKLHTKAKLNIFNNLKEAGEFLTDKLMIMELMK